MSDLPDLAILLLTYKRTREALFTIRSTIENLQYPREKIKWYIADDGSPTNHVSAIMQELVDRSQTVIGSHNQKFSDVPYAAGIGWNKGLGICYQATDYVLVLEDDWQMEAPLELTPYMKLLQDNQDVGLVSFRILSTGADVRTVGNDGLIYLEYRRTAQYAYSGNPHIRHARYTKYYGWYAEDRSPGLIELHQDDQYRFMSVAPVVMREDGPKIWRPAMLDQWGAWHHIGNLKTWE